MIKFSTFLKLDWWAIATIAFLSAISLLAIYSLSFQQNQEGFTNFHKQVIYLILGVTLFVFFSLVDYRIWKSYAGPLYLTGVILLIAVLFFGKTIRGTSGWFSLGFFNLQPVELAKLFLIISLAKYLSWAQKNLADLRHILISLTYIAIPAFLAYKQPDMGAVLVMGTIWLGMLFWSGLKKEYLLALILMASIVGILGYDLILNDIQKDRITTFLNPQKDPLGSGYNVIQSIIAVGSGGLHGQGLGHGSQSQLDFLPEHHTDFIFAAIAEESGLVGSALVLGLLLLLLWRIKKTSDKSHDNFGRLLVGGVMIMIFVQSLINIGMNLGIMPVAGLSLPLLSYGGSFLVSTMAALGLVQSVWIHQENSRRHPLGDSPEIAPLSHR
jgi:rod shape determining protein RodA